MGEVAKRTQELLEEGPDDEAVLAPGVYELRIEIVNVVKGGKALRVIATVVGGNGARVCPGMYGFDWNDGDGRKPHHSIENLLGWGITVEEIEGADNDLSVLARLLVGRVGRVELRVHDSAAGRVNAHKPGAVELVSVA